MTPDIVRGLKRLRQRCMLLLDARRQKSVDFGIDRSCAISNILRRRDWSLIGYTTLERKLFRHYLRDFPNWYVLGHFITHSEALDEVDSTAVGLLGRGCRARRSTV